ncbi:MAG: hypothetical protein EZS28_003847 [Streblomastix strix]|nr:MAG: hypothetical protein EZS28_003847 [Streblomastix strix]
MEKINLEEECRKPLLQKIVDVANKKTRNKELIKIQTDCASVLPFFLRIPDISDPNDSIQPNDTNLLQQIIHQWINIPGLDLLNSFLETISDNVPQIYIQRQIQVEIKKDSIQQQFKLLYEAVTPLLEEKPYTVEDQIDLIIKRLNVDDVLKVLESLAAKKRLNKENALHFYDQFKRHTYQLMKHLSRNMKEEEFGCGVTSLEKELLSSQNANIRRIGFELLTDDVSNLTEKEVKEKEENGEEEEEDDDNLFDSQQEEDDNQSQDEEKDQNDGSEIISKKQEKNKKRKYYRFWGAERRELLKKCQEDTSIFVQEPAMHFSFSADDN